KNGALIEIKGVQELELVAKVVELEVQRQTTLLQIRDELRTRNLKAPQLNDNFDDLTEQLLSSQSKIIQSAVKNGGVVLGTRLAGLKAAVDRAKEALVGVPEETRTANPDGTTQYMRPRPGAARMYPETDVPPVQISPERIRQIADNLPRMPEELAKEIGSKYEI